VRRNKLLALAKEKEVRTQEESSAVRFEQAVTAVWRMARARHLYAPHSHWSETGEQRQAKENDRLREELQTRRRVGCGKRVYYCSSPQEKKKTQGSRKSQGRGSKESQLWNGRNAASIPTEESLKLFTCISSMANYRPTTKEQRHERGEVIRSVSIALKRLKTANGRGT